MNTPYSSQEAHSIYETITHKKARTKLARVVVVGNHDECKSRPRESTDVHDLFQFIAY